ncbi:GGDEF domain-containing protein [Breoghania sp.]|uniref:GGDEF domain-containing protein n=1 Tax=Breoghania sp. TaxID=2065378 RepID=UPI0026164C3D|nr:GGDEF domain-containing protein [Breoghania sp.]MDJ0932396.1 GGDEF domain-containing protein [Breoghania sp.]
MPAITYMVEARTDALTGLLNRRAFNDLVSATPLQGSRSIILFDLDFFKALNDRHGHAFGDDVLRRFASVCRNSLRTQDIAARVGGEEFAVVLEGCPVERALVVGNRIRLSFAKQTILCGRERIRCTVRVGVYGSPFGETMTFEELYSTAGVTLYAAKEAGRNRVCRYRAEMQVA